MHIIVANKQISSQQANWRRFARLALLLSLVSATSYCYHDDSDSRAQSACSVSSSCLPASRMSQVITRDYEDKNDLSFSQNFEIADFIYNDQGSWIRGTRSSTANADLSYSIFYQDSNLTGFNKSFNADDLDTDVNSQYHYDGDQLISAYTLTSVMDADGNVTETYEEDRFFTYDSEGVLLRIDYDIDLLGEGTDLLFTYQGDQNEDSLDYGLTFNYENGLITSIENTDYTDGDATYTFKTFIYNGSLLISSTTFQTINNGDAVPVETLSYGYYEDGALKTKTVEFGTQLTISEYHWEDGGCQNVPIYGDRGYPTPEYPNFPCF